MPEAGDTIQTMKAGLLEIANLFVVNKSDRPDADALYRALRTMAHEQGEGGIETPVLKTTASSGEGIGALALRISDVLSQTGAISPKQAYLRAQKLFRLVQAARMADVPYAGVSALLASGRFASMNVYRLAREIAASGLPAIS